MGALWGSALRFALGVPVLCCAGVRLASQGMQGDSPEPLSSVAKQAFVCCCSFAFNNVAPDDVIEFNVYGKAGEGRREGEGGS